MINEIYAFVFGGERGKTELYDPMSSGIIWTLSPQVLVLFSEVHEYPQ